MKRLPILQLTWERGGGGGLLTALLDRETFLVNHLFVQLAVAHGDAVGQGKGKGVVSVRQCASSQLTSRARSPGKMPQEFLDITVASFTDSTRFHCHSFLCGIMRV